jgi:hypothetical protein
VIKYISFTLKLLLLSLTASYAQSGISNTDTIRCYNVIELRKIAKTATNLELCDSLLSNSRKRIETQSAIIREKDKQLDFCNKTVHFNQERIKIRDREIDNLNKSLRKERVIKKILTVCTITLSGISTTLLLIITI